MVGMKRDSDIQRVFEIADDSLQGVLGYHFYTVAAQKSADVGKVSTYLPPQLPMTFEWVRFYIKQDLVNLFTSPFFELFQSRISLIATTNVFEAALTGFIGFLSKNELYDGPPIKEPYKRHIEWAFRESLRSDIGNKETLGRLPKTFGMIDNARRLRNLIVHNHGFFDERYRTDAIDSAGIEIDLHPSYNEFIGSGKEIPIVFATDYLVRFILAHIEVLHVLHNGIQNRFFGVTDGYDYRREGKRIEWRSILLGSSKVRILFQGHRI
jgi:hypothetical protein